MRTTVNYPYTAETTSISTENSALGRFSDMKWTETVPFQLTPMLDGDISVIKRNFMDDISSFRTQSFPECDEKNDYLASFNHQLTGGFVGLYDENGGIIVTNARQALNSTTHCPMRLEKNKTVREGTADGINKKDLKSPVMTGISGNVFNYVTKGVKAIGHIIFTQIKSKK